MQTGPHPLADRRTSVAKKKKRREGGGSLEEQRTPSSALRRRRYSFENSRVRSDIFHSKRRRNEEAWPRWLLLFAPCRRRNSRIEHRDNKTGLLKERDDDVLLLLLSFFLFLNVRFRENAGCKHVDDGAVGKETKERIKKKKGKKEKHFVFRRICSLDTTASE